MPLCTSFSDGQNRVTFLARINFKHASYIKENNNSKLPIEFEFEYQRNMGKYLCFTYNSLEKNGDD